MNNQNKIFKPPISTTKIGHKFEYQALLYLENQGLSFIEKNYKSVWGEIDLILKNNNILIFVEVKARKSNNYGGAIYSITPSKQSKLILTAQHFLQKYPQYNNLDCRFDAVLFEKYKLQWLKNIIVI